MGEKEIGKQEFYRGIQNEQWNIGGWLFRFACQQKCVTKLGAHYKLNNNADTGKSNIMYCDKKTWLILFVLGIRNSIPYRMEVNVEGELQRKV